MIRKALFGAALASLIGLAACETGPTPYQPAAGAQSGFSDTRIETNRYRISFKGNSVTDKETVETYMLYRAAELTLQNGYDNFTITDRDTDKNTRLRQTDASAFSGPRLSYMYFAPSHGWFGAYDPFWTPSLYDEVTRYEAYAEILMGKGPKGADANAFDAHDVSKTLAGQVMRAPQ